MSNFIRQIKRFIAQIRGRYPSPIPTGLSEFNVWADSIIDTYPLPTAHRDSIHFTLATLIINLGPTTSDMPKYHFVRSFRAACAKQVAGQVFQDIKTRQREEEASRKAAEEAAIVVSSEITP